MSELIVFVNGEFVPESQARISIFDHAVLYGDGVFETAVAWDGRVFKLEQHLDRLFRSLAAINLKAPYPRGQLRKLILETVQRNELRNAYIKWIITRGVNGQPLLDPTGCTPGCIIFVRPYLYMTSAQKVQNGLRLKTTAIRRPPAEVLDPHIKSLNYLNLVLARLEAQAASADEALLLDVRGHVCEAPGYNVFGVHGKQLVTPCEDILAGITRETVLELATERGLLTREATIELYDLYTADEVLLCSTAGGILSVIEVDGRCIGEGKPGPIFHQLREAYQTLLSSPHHGTEVSVDPRTTC